MIGKETRCGRWGFSINGGYIKSGWYEGTSSGSTNLVQLQANVWYDAEIVLNGGEYIVRVWKQDTPGTVYERAETHSTWAGAAWKFHNQWHTAVGTFDNYQEYNPANSLGRRTLMKTTTSTWTAETAAAWFYDQRGRVVSESRMIAGSGTFVTQWGYNSGDMLSWIKYPGGNTGASGEQVNYTYLPQGALKTVSGYTAYAPDIQYDAAGRIDLLKMGGTVYVPTLKLDYVYNSWSVQGGRVQQIKGGTNTDGTSLQNLSYLYDEVGNIRKITDAKNSNQAQCFTYDALSRLTHATTYNNAALGCSAQVGSGVYDEVYGYDAEGRLSSKSGLGTLAYEDEDHIHAVTSATSRSFSYDANGNMIQRMVPAGGGSYTYTLVYDAENRLVEISRTGYSMQFVYDGDGKRVQSILNSSGTTTTAFIGGYFEWSGSTSTMVKYYTAAGRLVAYRTGAGTGTTGLLWLMADPDLATQDSGSTSKTANSDGTLHSGIGYRAWGEVRFGSTPVKYTYTGQYSESGLGLMFYQSRFYDPQLGRFITPDSIVPNPGFPLSWDRYAYTRNNPLRYVDPSGHICLESNGTEICSMDDDSNGWWADTGASCRTNPFQAMCYGVDQDGGEGLLKLVEFRQSTGTIETQVGKDLQIAFGSIKIGITFADYTANAMDKVPFTYKSIVWKIPNMVGGKYNIYEFTFVRGVGSGEVRNIGRALGEDLGGPAVLLAGYILAITPNIIENDLTNASPGEVVYELAVDSAGFVGGEIIGDSIQSLGSAAISPWFAIPFGTGVDYLFGIIWDAIWYGNGN